MSLRSKRGKTSYIFHDASSAFSLRAYASRLLPFRSSYRCVHKCNWNINKSESNVVIFVEFILAESLKKGRRSKCWILREDGKNWDLFQEVVFGKSAQIL